MDIIDKLKRILKKRGKTLDMVLRQVDPEDTGVLSVDQFSRAMKLISTDLTPAEIQEIIKRVDPSNTGVEPIDCVEFSKDFRDKSIFE